MEKLCSEGPAGWGWLCMRQGPWIQLGDDF